MALKLHLEGNAWQLQEVQTATARRNVQHSDPFVDRLLQTGKVCAEHFFRAFREGRRAVESRAPLEVTIEGEPKADYLLVVRHPFGAVTFHLPQEENKRRSGAARPAKQLRFRVEFPQDQNPIVVDARRSLAGKILKETIDGIVIKIIDKVAEKVLGAAARAWETAKWKNLPKGWVQITPMGLMTGVLPTADFSLIETSEQRSLLLLHGTFSNTVSAFQGLVATKGTDSQNFFAAMQSIYGDRIFGFNHFTVSKTPQQNARELLTQLPKAATFDVVTHSRGGLVLRAILETDLGSAANGFKAENIILVAAPNSGTPLATGRRWKEYLQWIVNVTEIFPENAVTLGIEFAVEGILWLAQRIKGSFPGLESMDMQGDMIKELQSPPGPPAQASYFALVANFRPKGRVLTKLAEAMTGSFFQSANDLIVPSEGGWLIDNAYSSIPAERIGCFGDGGNLDGINEDSNVFHTNFFAQPRTVDFLREALTGALHSIPPLDPAKKLPFGWRRGVGAAVASAAIAAEAPNTPVPEARRSALQVPVRPGEERKVFQLFVISPDDHLPADVISRQKDRTALVLATYKNARAIETVFIRGGGAKAVSNGAFHRPSSEEGGFLWSRIIKKSNRIRDYVNGKPNAPDLPHREQLQTFGADLFAAMFPDSVRRLYDVARSEAQSEGRRLDIVVTSMINWIADKPFEFVYDPDRQAYLATEDVNFTRNVLTVVPDDRVPWRKPPMRILIVVAQPIGMGMLSDEKERQLILRSFEELENEGLVKVEVMLAATPQALHERLRSFRNGDGEIAEGQFDLVHFIGHGEYRIDEDEGYLIFEDCNHEQHPVSAESLREILCQRGVRMVFLNACETGMTGRSQFPFDFNRGVAPKLVAGGIAVVVANQYKVLDVSATEFAKHFYRAIAQGATVGDAAREARVSVNYSIHGECIDWAVPVVYARDPSLRIFEPISGPHAAAVARAQTRPEIPPGTMRIGLWDVNHVVPGLEQIAQELSTSQDLYHFEVAELSAPVGTWRLVSDKPQPEGRASPQGIIKGEEVARKLSSQVSNLGYSRLFCITSFALGGKVHSEYNPDLVLWNDDPQKRIAIISGAKILEAFDEAHPLGRFIANTLVCALCGDPEHKKGMGPKDCPNYVSKKPQTAIPARLEYVAAKQRICGKCGLQLEDDKKKALEKLLAVY